jgi:hypothetical protein
MKKNLPTLMIVGLALSATAQFTPVTMRSLEWGFQNKIAPYDRFVFDAYSGSSVFRVYNVDVVRTGGRITSTTANSALTSSYRSTSSTSGNVFVATTEIKLVGDTTWTNDRRETMYSSGTNDTAYMQERWNANTSAWDTTDWRRLTWNGSDVTEIQSFDYQPATGTFKTGGIERMSYVGGNLVSDSIYSFNSSSGMHEPASFRIYFNTGARIDSTHVFGWDAATSTFKMGLRQFATHDANDKITKITQMKWDNSGNFWKNDNIQSWEMATGFGDASAETGISLYPNPARNSFVVESSGDAMVEVYNLAGSIIHTSRAGEHIECMTWPAGIYFVKVSHAGASRMHKLIIAE